MAPLNRVLWFTGLSGAGKTTLAVKLVEILGQEGFRCLTLDGDEIRKKLHSHLGFSREDIIENNHKIVSYCAENLPLFDFILVSVIAPFEDIRSHARNHLKHSYVEIFVQCSLKELIRRDPKGLYKKALCGEISNFIGIAKEVPYEEPQSPDLTVNTEINGLDICLKQLTTFLKKDSFSIEKGKYHNARSA